MSVRLVLSNVPACLISWILSNEVFHCKSIFSAPFYVYTAKKFPGMEGEYLLAPDVNIRSQLFQKSQHLYRVHSQIKVSRFVSVKI